MCKLCDKRESYFICGHKWNVRWSCMTLWKYLSKVCVLHYGVHHLQSHFLKMGSSDNICSGVTDYRLNIQLHGASAPTVMLYWYTNMAQRPQGYRTNWSKCSKDDSHGCFLFNYLPPHIHSIQNTSKLVLITMMAPVSTKFPCSVPLQDIFRLRKQLQTNPMSLE
jgi:hypothetical protein